MDSSVTLIGFDTHVMRGLLPIIALAGGIVALLVVATVKRAPRLSWFISLGALIATALLAAQLLANPSSLASAPGLVIDGLALLLIAVFCSSSAFCALMARPYLVRAAGERHHEEFYILLLLATLGASVMAAASHFATVFLGLEVLSVSLYGLIAYFRDRTVSIEAAIKYLVLAGAASAFLLMGMALLYTFIGSMEIEAIARFKMGGEPLAPSIFWLGIALLLVGAGFKLGLAPFHMWTPDVYEGSPAPVTAIIATISKGGMVAVVLRVTDAIWGSRWDELAPTLIATLSILAVASMTVGNLLALREQSLKRIIAFSSISHFGYMLIALIASAGDFSLGRDAVLFYMIAYFVTNLIALGVVADLSGGFGDRDRLEDYNGLLWRRPLHGVMLGIAMLSLAGIPLTGGFLAKVYVLLVGARAGQWGLIFALILNSTVGVYYYLRVIVHMISSESAAVEASERKRPSHRTVALALVGLSIVLLWLGVAPLPLLELIRTVN